MPRRQPAAAAGVAGSASQLGATVPSTELLQKSSSVVDNSVVKGSTRAFVENASIFLR